MHLNTVEQFRRRLGKPAIFTLALGFFLLLSQGSLAADLTTGNDHDDAIRYWFGNSAGSLEFHPNADSSRGPDITGRLAHGGWNLSMPEYFGGQAPKGMDFLLGRQDLGVESNFLTPGDPFDLQGPNLTMRFRNLDLNVRNPASGVRFASRPAAGEPKASSIKARYRFSLGPYQFEIGGGYGSYDVVKQAAEQEVEIESYVGYMGARIPFGPFYLDGSAFYGQNIGKLGLLSTARFSASDNILDTDSIGYLIGGGFVFGDMLTLQAAWGHAQQTSDRISPDFEEDVSAWYIQASIQLGKGISISPEVGAVTFGGNQKGPDDEDVFFYYGAKWQINF